MALWALSLRDQDRDPMNRDIDNEAQGLAAEAAARQNAGRGGGGARAGAGGAHRLERPRAPRAPADRAGHGDRRTHAGAGGHVGRADGVDRRRPAAAAAPRPTDAGGNVHHQRRERPADARAAGAAERRGGSWRPRRRRRRSVRRRPGMVFARDGRTLYFRSGERLFAAPITLTGGHGRRGRSRRPWRGRRTWTRRCSGGGADTPANAATPAQTARQVTYTANLEVDHKALRAQVFNEGWRIMKNRFYDAKMHGADWNAVREMYEPLLDNLVDEEELHTVMMMMIGQLNASHTGVSGGPNPMRADAQTRYPGFDLVADPSGFYKVGHIYKDGPADHDYLKIKDRQFHRRGRRPRAEDSRQLLAVLHAGAGHQVPLPASTTSRRRTARGK